MEWLIVIAFIGWVILKGTGRSKVRKAKRAVNKVTKPIKAVTAKPKKAAAPKQSPIERKLNEALESWLQDRWELAKRGGVEAQVIIPRWFNDDISEGQTERLEEIGINPKNLTKGQASDIIGLTEKPEPERVAVLKFFGVTTGKMSQSEARHRAAELMSDPDNVEKYENRPASPIQKEMYRFFGFKTPANLTNPEAKEFESSINNQACDEENTELESKIERWECYRENFEELQDPEVREDYWVKSISLPLYREAYQRLVDANKVGESGYFDLEELVNEAKEIKPEIEKIA